VTSIQGGGRIVPRPSASAGSVSAMPSPLRQIVWLPGVPVVDAKTRKNSLTVGQQSTCWSGSSRFEACRIRTSLTVVCPRPILSLAHRPCWPFSGPGRHKKPRWRLDIGSGIIKLSVIDHSGSEPELVNVATTEARQTPCVEARSWPGLVSEAIGGCSRALGQQRSVGRP